MSSVDHPPVNAAGKKAKTTIFPLRLLIAIGSPLVEAKVKSGAGFPVSIAMMPSLICSFKSGTYVSYYFQECPEDAIAKLLNLKPLCFGCGVLPAYSLFEHLFGMAPSNRAGRTQHLAELFYNVVGKDRPGRGNRSSIDYGFLDVNMVVGKCGYLW